VPPVSCHLRHHAAAAGTCFAAVLPAPAEAGFHRPSSVAGWRRAAGMDGWGWLRGPPQQQSPVSRTVDSTSGPFAGKPTGRGEEPIANAMTTSGRMQTRRIRTLKRLYSSAKFSSRQSEPPLFGRHDSGARTFFICRRAAIRAHKFQFICCRIGMVTLCLVRASCCR
jgi:hypothetical protein